MSTKTRDERQRAGFATGEVGEDDFSGPARAFLAAHGGAETYYSGSSKGAAMVNTPIGTLKCADVMRLWQDAETREALIALVVLGEQSKAAREGGLDVAVHYTPPGVTYLSHREPDGAPIYAEMIAGWFCYLSVGGLAAVNVRGLSSEAEAWTRLAQEAEQFCAQIDESKPAPAAGSPDPTPAERSSGRWPWQRSGKAGA